MNIREKMQALRPFAISEAEARAITRADAERERTKRSRRLAELSRVRPGEHFTASCRRVNADRCRRGSIKQHNNRAGGARKMQ
ncbi:MAG: hypothetical protein LBK76_02530 [Verrucomicrobiales bacterium]|jgi:hypothetical protein|nr:hypothetical protein [Verrucomicrobiales bacterium]